MDKGCLCLPLFTVFGSQTLPAWLFLDLQTGEE